MVERSGGSAFASGFMGCLGALAVVVAVVVAIFAWSTISDFRKGIRAEDVEADRITLADPAAPCREALDRVTRAYRVAAPLTLQTWPEAHSVKKGEAFRCRVSDAKNRDISVLLRADCDAPSAGYCETIDAVTRLDGKPVRPR